MGKSPIHDLSLGAFMSDENEATEAGIRQGTRDEAGRFLPGVSGNPGGARKGKRTAMQEIEQAVEDYEKETGKGYWYTLAILGMKLAQEKGNTSLLAKILDKFLASLDRVDANVTNQRPIVMMDNIKVDRGDGKGLVDLHFNIGSPLPLPEGSGNE
jgi:hypothetical protein